MAEDTKKSMTIDDLAVVVQAGFKSAKEDNESLARMVAGGFEKVTERMDGLTERMDGLTERMDGLTERMDGVEHQVKALNSNVNNYLELSEKRYVELKQRDVLLAKWIKLVAEKTGVPVDVSLLEKI